MPIQNFIQRLKAISPDGVLVDTLGPFRRFWVDPVNGSDGRDGTSYDKSMKTIAAAYAKCTAGLNDTIILVGSGADAGTARMDASFTWAKDATHLIGIAAPNQFSGKARIAPTLATTAFTPFWTISGKGCYFRNIEWFHGFTTGTTAMIGVIISGSNCMFENCNIAGMGDTASATSATSRTMKITGTGHVFNRCTIGHQSVARTVANALVEFYSGAARIKFDKCLFLSYGTTAATQLDLLSAAGGALGGTILFDDCQFVNDINLASYNVQTAVFTGAASSGGTLIFRNCSLLGHTGFGTDATSRGFIRIDGGPPTAGTTGLCIAPTA